MRWQTILTQSRDYLFFSMDGMTERERAHYTEGQRRQSQELALRLSTIALVVLPVSAMVVYAMSPHPQKVPQTLSHLVPFFVLVCMRFFHKFRKIDLRYASILAQLSIATGYSLSMRISFAEYPDRNDVAFLSNLFIAIMIFNIVLHPFKNASVLLSAVYHVILTNLAWSAAPDLKSFDWVIVVGICASFALGIFYTLSYRFRIERVDELATLDLLTHAQKHRIDAMQSALRAAGEIQDSAAPQQSLFTKQGFKVSYYQIKHEILGGDWFALRSLPTGELIIAVADATGKGIQAALVIHSIQTLWANALSQSDFNALDWLNAANRTLIALGRRKEHTLSLGLVVINAEKIIYYSAGHLPLIVLFGTENSFQVSVLPSRGSLLGMNEELFFSPKEMSRFGKNIEGILLATDGVFENSRSFMNDAINKLLTNVRANGTRALENCPAEDDKLLVWLEKIN
jgi:hypothetical protein